MMENEPYILNLLIEAWLEEVRVVRSRRTPSRLKLKRKRYYRKRKATLKRKAKRRSMKPKSKRAAKRRKVIRKRLRLKPGSRKRLSLSMTHMANIMEGRAVTNTKMDLIRGFKNAIKLAEQLDARIKPVDVVAEVVSEDSGDMFDLPPLPASIGEDYILDEEFESFFGMKNKSPKRLQEGTTFSKIKKDALYFLNQIDHGMDEEDEAVQALTMMVEHLDREMTKVIGEGKSLTESVSMKWKELPNGSLEVSLADPKDAEDLMPAGDYEHFFDAFEYMLTNGMEMVAPEEIGALTDAPIFGEVERDDDGNIVDTHSLYWYPQYETKDPVDELKKNGKVIFASAKAKVDEAKVNEVKVEGEVPLHSTFKSDTYYVAFDKLPAKAQEILKAAEPELENSSYTVHEDKGFIRAKVEVNGKLWDAEISLGSVDIQHSDYKYVDGEYLTDDGAVVDSDEYSEQMLKDLMSVVEIENYDVYLSNPEDLDESKKDKSSMIGEGEIKSSKDVKPDGVKNLTHMIMSSMVKIEKEKGKIFTDIDAALETKIFKAIDEKNVGKLNQILKKLDAMQMDGMDEVKELGSYSKDMNRVKSEAVIGEEKIKLWKASDNYSGEDMSDYYVGPGRSRDSDVLANSNFESALEQLGGEDGEQVMVGHFGHWAVGWIEQIFVHKDAKDKVAKLQEIADKLADYPILDDDDYYEQEKQELEDTFDGNKSIFVRDLAKAIGLEDPTPEQEKELEVISKSVLQWSAGYYGNEDAWVDPQSMKKMSDHDWKDLEHNHKGPLLAQLKAAIQGKGESVVEAKEIDGKKVVKSGEYKGKKWHIVQTNSGQMGSPVDYKMVVPCVFASDYFRSLEPWSIKREMTQMKSFVDDSVKTESYDRKSSLTESKGEIVSRIKQLEADTHKAMHKAGVEIPSGADVPFTIHGYDKADTVKEKNGKVFEYPEMVHFNVESWETMKYSMTSDGRIIREGTPLNGKGVSKDQLIANVIENVKAWNEHIAALGAKRQEKKALKSEGKKPKDEKKEDTYPPGSQREISHLSQDKKIDKDQIENEAVASNQMLDSYIEAALWSSNDQSDEQGGDPLDKNYGPEDIDPETLEQMKKDVSAFVEKAGLLLDGIDDEQAGHDFWLTRNRHGAGFWDRGYEKEIGEKLTDLCHKFGEVDLYVGDDGKIYA